MNTNTKQFLFLSLMLTLLISACKTDEKQTEVEVDVVPGIVLENMDTDVRPQDDFYNYVNGTWMKTNEIPEEEARWGGFMVLRKSTRNDVLEIVNTAKELGTYAEGTDQKKALLLMESELDSLKRDEVGLAPLKPMLDAIDGISSIEDMQTVYAVTPGVDAPFVGFTVFPDLNDSKINAGYITTGGLGLPDRDYYVLTDEKSDERRAQYVDHVTRMLQYIDYDEAGARQAAEMILEVETKLAEPRLDKTESRNISNYNNPRTLAEINEMTPAINWNKFIKDIGIEKEPDTLFVLELRYMKALRMY